MCVLVIVVLSFCFFEKMLDWNIGDKSYVKIL